MERKYASAGPNKQMYDMYNTNVRNLNGFDSAAYISADYPGSIQMNAPNTDMARTSGFANKLETPGNQTGALS